MVFFLCYESQKKKPTSKIYFNLLIYFQQISFNSWRKLLCFTSKKNGFNIGKRFLKVLYVRLCNLLWLKIFCWCLSSCTLSFRFDQGWKCKNGRKKTIAILLQFLVLIFYSEDLGQEFIHFCWGVEIHWILPFLKIS